MAERLLAIMAGLALPAVLLTGCASPQSSDEEVSTGLSRLTGPDSAAIAPAEGPRSIVEEKPAPGSLEAAAAQNAALNLLAWHDQHPQPAETPEPAPAKPVATPALPPPPSVSAEAAADSSLMVGPPAPADLALDEQIADAADHLKGLLRQKASTSPDRFASALDLASLEPIQPGIVDELTQGASAADLSPAERSTIRAFAAVADALGAPGVGGDPAKAADAIQSAIDGLGASLPIRLRTAELCTRVDGFGQYDPVQGNVFQAMRPHRVIVYTEVERFAYRPIGEVEMGSHRAGPGDQWAVALTQQLELYNESGAMSAWSRPALPIVETSRNKRRDFHIVDQIELPPNLSIGVYHLKITVKDKTTGSQDTRNVELRVVADPALARGDK